MKTFIKILAGILALLFIIIVGLNLYFTNERLQNMLMPYINESVGRSVEVETISVTLLSTFPNPGVEVVNLNIPGDTSEDTLLSMNRLIVGVELFPLFRDEINITELTLDKPKFTYIIYADSTTNLDFLSAEEEADTASAASYDVNIPYFEVIDGYFGYRDFTSATSAALDEVDGNLSLSYADSIQSSIDVEVGGLSATVDSVTYLNGLPLRLTEESVIHTGSEIIRLKEGTFSVRGLEMDLTGELSDWSSAFAVDLAFNSTSDNFGNLLGLVPETYMESIEGLESRGSLDLGGTIRGPVAGDSIPLFDVLVKVQDGYLKDPELSQPVEDIQVAARATNEQVVIETLNAVAGSNSLNGSGIIEEPLEDNASFNMDFVADVDLSTVHQFFDIAEMNIEQLGGQLDIDANAEGPLAQPENVTFDGKAVLADGLLKYLDVPEAIRDINIHAAGTQDLLTIESLSLQAAQNTLAADGQIQNLLDESSRHINMNTSLDFDLATIKEFYPIEEDSLQLEGLLAARATLNGPAGQIERAVQSGSITLKNGLVNYSELDVPFRNITLESTLDGPRITLNQLTFNAGASDIDLQGSLSNYIEYLKEEKERKATPRLTGQFRSNHLNLDELMDWSEDTTSSSNIELPDLNGDFSAQIDSLTFTGVTLRNLQAKATTTPSQVNLTQASVNLFGGEASGIMKWTIPGDRPSTFNFKGALNNLRLESFFEEYPILGRGSQFHKFITGTFSTDIDYTTKIDTMLNPLIPTTVLSGTFGMSKAQVQNHPLQQKIAGFSKINALSDVALDQWKSTVSVNNSVLTISDLSLTSSDMGMELNGTQHLQTDKINFHVSLILPGRLKKTIAPVISSRAANALTRDNGTITVPLRITGNYGNPSVQPDQTVIKPIIQEYLKDKAGNTIRDLFGRDKKEQAQPDTAAADTPSS